MKKQLLPFMLMVLLPAFFIPVANAQITNIALGKTVTAQATTAGAAANVVDGDTATKWQSAAVWSQWIYVDLATASYINKIIVRFDSGVGFKGYPLSYDIQVSNNAGTWTTIDSIRSNAQATNIRNVSTTARYVRLQMIGRAGTNYSIKEFEVYGGIPNVALGKMVTAQATAAGAAANVVDGDTATKWQSAAVWSQWIYVDLSARHDLNKIRVLFDSGAVTGWAVTYYVQVSDNLDNPANWTTIDSLKSNTKATTTINNLSATARYVRILLAGRAGPCYIIKELEVYGTPNANNPNCDPASIPFSEVYPPAGYYPVDISDTGRTSYLNRIAAFKANPLSCGDIVMIGNSITQHGGDWATRLCSPLVRNRGIASDITEGVIARLGEIYYYKPKKVFILIGINNLAQSKFTAKYVADSICGIVNKIHSKSPLTEIYVQTILPTLKPYFVTKIKETNDSLKAREHLQPYTLIDIHALLADNNDLIKPEYTTDSTHLTEPAYRIWVKELVDKYDITPVSTGNLALTKPVITSTILDGAHMGNKAVDGDTTTKWKSAHDATNNSLYVDLARTYTIQKIIIRWDAVAFSANFRIQASDDELNWTTIASVSGNTSSYTELTNLTGQGRYIRMIDSSNGGSLGYAVNEFEVYGTPASAMALPAQLVNFNAALQQNHQVAITWETTSGINNNYFLLEKSRDGKNYTPLLKINSLGEGLQKYSFTDADPFKGYNYYRLQQVDNDGAKNYTAVKRVNNMAADLISVFPNPVTGHSFVIRVSDTKNVGTVQLVDVSGRIILTQKVPANTVNRDIEVQLPATLIPGIYIVKMGNASVSKILVKH